MINHSLCVAACFTFPSWKYLTKSLKISLKTVPGYSRYCTQHFSDICLCHFIHTFRGNFFFWKTLIFSYNKSLEKIRAIVNMFIVLLYVNHSGSIQTLIIWKNLRISLISREVAQEKKPFNKIQKSRGISLKSLTFHVNFEHL